MATVKLPVIGETDRRWVFVGAAAVAVIVAWAYWRRGRGGGVAYDPSTGTPGSQTGYVNPVPDGPDAVDPGPGPRSPSNNSEWGQLAIADLVELGADGQFAALAIGKYLSSVGLTTAEADMVRRAFGVTGDPPNKLPIIMATTAPAPGGGTSQPLAHAGPPHIHHVIPERTTALVQWYPGKGASRYEINVSGAGQDSHVVGTATGLSFNVAGLKAGTRYYFSVRSLNAAGQGGTSSLSNVVTTTTKK